MGLVCIETWLTSNVIKVVVVSTKNQKITTQLLHKNVANMFFINGLKSEQVTFHPCKKNQNHNIFSHLRFNSYKWNVCFKFNSNYFVYLAFEMQILWCRYSNFFLAKCNVSLKLKAWLLINMQMILK